MEQLTNGIISIVVSPMGAELQSLHKVGSTHEYIWQGDPAYWNRRAPVLFPIVGKVWNGQFFVDGQPYTLGQHGFARDMLFTKVVDEPAHIAFAVRADEDSLRHFPFDFELRIDYTLRENILTIGWRVTNNDTRTMPFQIGAHPAFNYPEWSVADELHGYLSTDVVGPLKSTKVSGGYAIAETFDVDVPTDGLLPLGNSTFDCDTILEATGRVRRVCLYDRHRRPLVTVRHTMPVTAFWSPCNGAAPFVCIEPWHGRCDAEGYSGEAAGRHFIELLSPGKSWQTSYDIIID